MRDHWRNIRSFTSDGCTGVPDLDIRNCCEVHDYMYHHGMSTAMEPVTRAEADRIFRELILAHGRPVVAWVYWAGVRLLGGGIWRRHRARRPR